MTLHTLDEFAVILRVSRRTVQRLVSEGKVRVVHPSPRRTCVTDREVKAYLAYIEGRRRVA